MSETGPNLSSERPIDVLAREEVLEAAAVHLDNYLGLLATCRSVKGNDLAMTADSAVDAAGALARSGLPLGEHVHSSAIMLGIAVGTIYIQRGKVSSGQTEYQQATEAGIKMLAACDLAVPPETLEELGWVNHQSLRTLRLIMMPETPEFAAIERQWGIPMSAAEKLALKVNARTAIMRYGGSKIINGILLASYKDRLNSLPDF